MQKYTFYVGAGYTHDGRPLDGPAGYEFVQIEHLLIDRFGAFTKVIGEGAYTSSKNPGIIAREPVVLYTIFVDFTVDKGTTTLHKMYELAKELASIARQESVLLEAYGTGSLVHNPSL